MNREERKRAYLAKRADFRTASCVDPFAEVSFRAAFEAVERSSDRRFEKLRFRNAAVNAIRLATDQFAKQHGLATSVMTTPAQEPLLMKGCFKYSHHDEGCLADAQSRLAEGERLTIALVTEESIAIGYAIAERTNVQGLGEVAILDVDVYSRRETGLCSHVEIESGCYQVGVAHVVLKALIDHCTPPLITDATNDASRYVFKSLGFVHVEGNPNPCILELAAS